MKQLGLLVLLAMGCGPIKQPPAGPFDAGSWFDQALKGCRAQGPTPRTIPQMVERLNGLPRPVSIACVIASLPRPLTVVASTSAFSAQPADGRRSPRIFILGDRLILSIVPAGPGAKLLEFGELITATRTLKGELKFPITAQVPMEAPFTQVMMGNFQTNCSLCHRAESPHPSIDGGFVSAAFRPDPGNLVPLAELRELNASCDPNAERERCEILMALLGLGTTIEGKFPSQFELFIK